MSTPFHHPLMQCITIFFSVCLSLFKKNLFMYLFMAELGLPFCVSFSLVTMSGTTLQLQCTGFSLQWLPLQLSVSSKKCLLQQWLYMVQQLQFLGSKAVVHRLSCSEACGIFLDQESKLGLLLWYGIFTTEPLGKPNLCLFQR